MPRRSDISSILVIGAGPIVIGQACEFDYSGTQAVKALKDEGFRVVLVNSNPATIMTDPGLADATYVEPITPEVVTRVVERERPDALLPTMGGQTALNTARATGGVLERFETELIGATLEAIDKAEDRERFQALLAEHGLRQPPNGTCRSAAESWSTSRKPGSTRGTPPARSRPAPWGPGSSKRSAFRPGPSSARSEWWGSCTSSSR